MKVRVQVASPETRLWQISAVNDDEKRPEAAERIRTASSLPALSARAALLLRMAHRDTLLDPKKTRSLSGALSGQHIPIVQP